MLAVVALLALAATGLASASQLGTSGDALTTVDAGHPCPGTATATAPVAGSSLVSGVQLTLPAGCGGTREAQAVLLNGTTQVVAPTGTVTGSGTLATGPYLARRTLTAQATVDGWMVPVTWSWAPSITCRVTDAPTVPCTATVARFIGTKPNGSAAATYYDVVVTTTSATPVRWEVTFNFQHTFYGAAPTALGNSTLDTYYDGATTWDGQSTWNPDNDVQVSGGCAAYPGTFVVVGTPTGPSGNTFQTVSSSRQRRFSMVTNQNGNAAYSDVYPGGC